MKTYTVVFEQSDTGLSIVVDGIVAAIDDTVGMPETKAAEALYDIAHHHRSWSVISIDSRSIDSRSKE